MDGNMASYTETFKKKKNKDVWEKCVLWKWLVAEVEMYFKIPVETLQLQLNHPVWTRLHGNSRKKSCRIQGASVNKQINLG